MRPKDGLYHIEIGFPKVLNTRVGIVGLEYTRHAQAAAIADRYGIIDLPPSLNTNTAQCIEVEYKSGYVTKLVYRSAYNMQHDLVLVVSIDRTKFVVRTVWLNSKQDLHKTLDRSKYVKVA